MHMTSLGVFKNKLVLSPAICCACTDTRHRGTHVAAVILRSLGTNTASVALFVFDKFSSR